MRFCMILSINIFINLNPYIDYVCSVLIVRERDVLVSRGLETEGCGFEAC